MVGLAYLVWALVAGVTRGLVRTLVDYSSVFDEQLPLATRAVRVVFVEGGSVIDLVGLVWLVVCLVLVAAASRQRVSISWAWLAGMVQVIVAALGGIFVAWAVHLPYQPIVSNIGQPNPWAKLSGLSLPVLLVVALLIWVMFLVFLLIERSRLSHRGPTLRDGLRTNMYR